MSKKLLCPDCRNMNDCPILLMSDGAMKYNHCYSFKATSHAGQFVADVNREIDVGKQMFDLKCKIEGMDPKDRARIIIIEEG